MTRISFKGQQVVARRINPRLFEALAVAARLWETLGVSELVVTSLNDQTHRSGSLHYNGDAADLRTWNIPPKDRGRAASELGRLLGADFDVVLESDHIHVEFDPEEAPRDSEAVVAPV